MTKTSPRLAVNTVAVCAVAILAALGLSAFRGFWDSSTFGEFGFDTGFAGGPIGHSLITDVVPGSPADMSGLKPGDSILRPATMHDRLLVIGEAIPQPGERLSLSVSRNGVPRTVQVQARRIGPLSLSDNIGDKLLLLTLLTYLAVGLVLALLRPSIMTWSFCLFAYALVNGWSPCSCWGYFSQVIPTAVYGPLSQIQGPLVDFGIVGFLVFCVRFPSDLPTGWRRRVGQAAVLLAVVLTAIGMSREWYLDDFRMSIADDLSHVYDALALAVLIAGVAIFLTTFFGARDLERHKIKWVVLGLLCAVIPAAATLLSWEGRLDAPVWIFNVLNLLLIPLPLTVAYAVIRHRVIDVRFVLSRSLAIGAIASVVAIVVAGTDWLFSTRLTSSRFEGAAYVGIALLVGFSLNAAIQWLGRMMDALFFRRWSQTQEQAEAIARDLKHAASPAEVREPLTAGIGRALSLASAALFERIESGGFVRTSSFGWPRGTIWHILADDPLARRASERGRVAHVENVKWNEGDVPAGVARPISMVSIVAGRGVAAILLCGAHEDGTAIDPDEQRIIRNLAADASIVFQMTRSGVPLRASDSPHFASN